MTKVEHLENPNGCDGETKQQMCHLTLDLPYSWTVWEPNCEPHYEPIKDDNNPLHVCGCISDEVNSAIKKWVKNGKPKFNDPGVTNIFACVADGNNDELEDDEGIRVQIELLWAIVLQWNEGKTECCKKFKLNPEKCQVVEGGYPPTFCQKRYSVSFNESMVLLHWLDFSDLVEHGGGLRTPFLSDKGESLLTMLDKDCEIGDRMADWCSSNKWGVHDVESDDESEDEKSDDK